MPSHAANLRPPPPTSPLSLSIVLPCFNEEGNVERVAMQALEFGGRIARELEIIIVYDGSSDRTGAIADDLAQRRAQVRVLHLPHNHGYGAALTHGLKNARCDWIFYTDGDGRFDLAQLALLPPLLKDHDVVIGSRIDRADHWLRRVSGYLWASQAGDNKAAQERLRRAELYRRNQPLRL